MFNKILRIIKETKINNNLLTAVNDNNLSQVKVLLEQGADIDYQNRYGRTSLHLSLLNADIRCLQYLLVQQPNVNQQDFFGLTPMHIAVCHNKSEAIKFLLDKNPDTSIKDNLGRTVFDITKKYNKKSIHNLLELYSEEKHLNNLIMSNAQQALIQF